jgi:hypothetical protein
VKWTRLEVSRSWGVFLWSRRSKPFRRANRGTVSEKRLRRAFEECWWRPLDRVAHDFGFSDEMLAAGWAENARAEVRTPMRGYGDLEVLAELPALLFLVTSGFRPTPGEQDPRARHRTPLRANPGGRDRRARSERQGTTLAEILREYGLSPDCGRCSGATEESTQRSVRY